MMPHIYEQPDLPQLLQRELTRGQADPRWRRWLAPQLSYGRHAGPARSDAQLAAVAIVFYQQHSAWHVPLTVRPAGLRTHAGQVSFPGGGLEAGENSRNAAHRELVEELFADRQPADVNVDWLGALAPLHVFVSNMLVTPWVGVLRDRPDWQPQPAEVEQVLPLPLELLLGDDQPDEMTVRRGSLAFSAPRLMVNGIEVWGSTAVLLGELRGWLRRLAAGEETA
ncbi:MAG: CoA pyrophosphatase [Planctomycetes bacterium]|nr:CoA pyrophosphatase [Planctomycetota bacterium]